MTLKSVNNFINDVLFFVFTLVCDIALLNKIRNLIKNKEKMVENFKESEENKRKKRILKMIIINSVIFMLSHLPEMVSSILIFFYQNKLNFCAKFKCDKLNEYAQFFIYFTIIAQFGVNKQFNSLFRQSYEILKLKVKNRF